MLSYFSRYKPLQRHICPFAALVIGFSPWQCIAATDIATVETPSSEISLNETELNFNYSGHIKYQPLLTHYPDNSFYLNNSDSLVWDHTLSSRQSLSTQKNAWSIQIDYQLHIQSGNSVKTRKSLVGFDNTSSITPNDDQRILDLTHLISTDDDALITHRLDRLYYGYSTENNVFRIGRQAISWGNGMLYNPMDFFNPFDPSSIDKEYKSGDDLLYSQHLFDNNSDIQMVWVGRRNTENSITQNVASLAVKYHRFVNESEVDFLVAQHFNDTIIAIGAVINLADAILRSDIILTNLHQTNDTVVSAVLNGSYSWVLLDKNMSAVLEYYHNGFGVNDCNYAPHALSARPELMQRLQRGELFTLAQDYLAASVTLELTPLWVLTSNVFWNLNDASSFLQILSQHDIEQNIQFFAALNLPTGDAGTEFGGIDSYIPHQALSIDASLFAQIAWYF